MRPSRTASSSASGIDAADVFACRSTVVDHLAPRHAQFVRGRIDDPDVRLVRDQPVDRLGGRAVGGERLVRGLRQHLHGELEHRAAVHVHERRARRRRHRRASRARRASRDGGRRRAGATKGCPARARAPARRRPRRRRTARTCRDRSSRGCASRSRRRRPARCAPSRTRRSGRRWRARRRIRCTPPARRTRARLRRRASPAGCIAVDGKHHVGRRRRDDDEVDVRGRDAARPRGQPATHAARDRSSARPARRSGARESPCARGSTHRSCRCAARDRRWSGSSPAGSRRSRRFGYASAAVRVDGRMPCRATDDRHRRHPLGDLVEHAVRRLGVGLGKRVSEREHIGAAVALHHDALQPDQRRAVVPPRIDPALERPSAPDRR